MDPPKAIDEISVDAATLALYKRNYSLPVDAPVTKEMVRHHWILESELTQRLLRSTPEERWQVFEDAYSRLYRECYWLNAFSVSHDRDDNFNYRHFLTLLGDSQSIYEIGSGKAGLINYLARHGRQCVATEITRERGAPYAVQDANPIWHQSDGVHLERFEPANRYDAVVSTQVIEHLHPEDLVAHFRGVLSILKPGGKYAFNTPHHLFGPRDLSAVFGKDAAVCMHLKEYYAFELAKAAEQAGFGKLKGVYLAPGRLRKKLPIVIESGFYLGYLQAVERWFAARRARTGERPPIGWLRVLLFTADVFLTAVKPAD